MGPLPFFPTDEASTSSSAGLACVLPLFFFHSAAPVRWGAHLNHFLGYFPYPKPVIMPLVELRRSLAPCFAPLPAGEKGREREGVLTSDVSPSSSVATSAGQR